MDIESLRGETKQTNMRTSTLISRVMDHYETATLVT